MPLVWPRSPPGRSFTDPGARQCYVAILALPGAAVDVRPIGPPGRTSARRERLDRSGCVDRVRAPVDRDGRPDLSLGDDLHLRGHRDYRAIVGVVALARHRDTDGHRHQRVPALLALPVDDRDVTFAYVVRVMQQRHTLVEAGDGSSRERLHLVRLADHHEVVTADVADEWLCPDDLGPDALERRGEQGDHVVAAQPAVAVVERLEVVEVDVAHGERAVAVGTRRDLFVDPVVAGQT